VRQPAKRTPETSSQQELRLRSELSRARRTISQLKAETIQLRKQLEQRQVVKQRVNPSGTNASRPAQARPAHQSPPLPQREATSRTVRVPPQSPSWGSRPSSGQKPRQAGLAPSQPGARRRRRVANRPNRMGRKLFSGLVAMVGIAVLVGTTISLKQFTSSKPSNPSATASKPSPTPLPTAPPPAYVNNKLVYNVRQPPTLDKSQELQTVVGSAVDLAKQKGFDTENLSITVINLKTNQIADHKGDMLRYPASVAKFFWMVMAFAQVNEGTLKTDPKYDSDMSAMVVYSDNDAASRVIDRISGAESGGMLEGGDLKAWFDKRMYINEFFQKSGFDGLYVAQKNYPVYSLGMEGPTGRETQLKDQNGQMLRSRVTTNQSSRLMYDIYNGLAVSGEHSKAMIALLKRDLRPEVWKKDPLNCVAGFLGEFLPPNTIFAGKIGYTTKTRHEVAFVETPDRSTAYVVTIFGDDEKYSRSETILPELSRHIYNKMTGTAAGAAPTPSATPQPSPGAGESQI